jgi:outer membrane protein TolC
MARLRFWVLPCAAVWLLNGCLLLPAEYRQQVGRKTRLDAWHNRQAPDETPTDGAADWQQLVKSALRNNGRVAAAEQEWRASLERVKNAAAYPNTNLHAGIDYRVGAGGAPSDRIGFTLGNDPMMNLSLPVKVTAAAEVALAGARAAWERLRARRVELQQQVLDKYVSWAGTKRLHSLEQERVRWLSLLESSLRARYGAASDTSQTELARAQSERVASENRAARYQAEAEAAEQELNALAGRPPGAPLALPEDWPIRPRLATPEELVARVPRDNPAVREQERETAGQQAALHLARLQYLPDLNPMAGLSGTGLEAIGGALVLPLAWRKIAAAVAEARVLLERSRQLLAQAERDQPAQARATAVLFADVERQIELWRQALLPLAEIEVRSAQAAYRAGRLPLSTWAEAQNRRLALEQELVGLLVLREQLWTRLEALAGLELAPSAGEVGAEVADDQS